MSNPIAMTGIDHPALAADDVDKLAEWYCNVLGYTKYFRHDKPVWMLMAPDNSLIEIMPKDDTLRQSRTCWTPGWSHLALRVENLDKAMKYLESVGVVWESEIMDAIAGGRVRNFSDPEGNMLQVLERVFIK